MSEETCSRQITFVKYSESLARGQAAMEQGDLAGAMAYFKMAKGFMETQEINALIEEVSRKLR